MIRILGIDPGSRITGWGMIESDGRYSRYIDSGHIRVDRDTLPDKLGFIFSEVGAVVEQHRPAEMAIEEVFVSRSAGSALKLGQARGAAICAGVSRDLVVAEYSARFIKQAVVGAGGADKTQVQHMVGILLNLRETLQADAADALAVALCHAHMRESRQRLANAGVPQ
ncbi:MAG TPA: crossover junction endodeoxyribonuclease RuvC [Gammaproteobacteria bacterium]|nr:crossover junction endodeoxyribonuclease RuvC [Gammaproteobacteria bacterium]